MSRSNRDEKVNEAARREAREGGYEYRPTSKKMSDEAERLERGFAMLTEDSDGIDIDAD